jgi:predicted nucleotidyltransferase
LLQRSRGRKTRIELAEFGVLKADVATDLAQDELLVRTVVDAVDALEHEDIPYVVIGGLASSLLGRPRMTRDIDFLVRDDDAVCALAALRDAGFDTEETNPKWIYKAVRDDVTIDVIFWLKGDFYLDDEMLERARDVVVGARTLKVIPPEDLIVVKAVIHDEQTPRHWHDALGVIADQELDWEYLHRRARHGARRVLALLLYAQSNDLIVPDEAIKRLYEMIYGA